MPIYNVINVIVFPLVPVCLTVLFDSFGRLMLEAYRRLCPPYRRDDSLDFLPILPCNLSVPSLSGLLINTCVADV